MKIEKLTVLIFLAILLASLLLFYPSLNYYFFQDDWFVLNWVRTGNLSSFLLPNPQTIYWRPLSMPLFFWTAYKIFGLETIYYHAFIFLVFFCLIVSVYKLFNLLLGDKKISLLAAFLYALWPIHFMSLSWLSTASYILMTLFQVISFIFFIKFTKNGRKYFWAFSFSFFIAGMLSHEFTLVLPLIFVCWGFMINKKNYIKYIAPYLLVDLIFLIFRFIIYPISDEGSYKMYFNKLIVDNFFWYIAWSFNFPESFKDLIDQRFPVASFKTLIGSWKIFLPALMTFLIIIKLMLDKARDNSKYIAFAVLWFTIGLLPIITLVNHSYTVYLSFASLGFLFLISQLLKKAPRIYVFLIILCWITASFSNLDFTRKTHWIVNEQAISAAYVTYSRDKIGAPVSGSLILLREADGKFQQNHKFTLVSNLDILKQSLSDQNAMQVIYNDSSLKSDFAKPLQPLDYPNNLILYYLVPIIDK